MIEDQVNIDCGAGISDDPSYMSDDWQVISPGELQMGWILCAPVNLPFKEEQAPSTCLLMSNWLDLVKRGGSRVHFLMEERQSHCAMGWIERGEEFVAIYVVKNGKLVLLT